VNRKKQKRSSHGWKLRYEALRFQPFSIMLPLAPLSRVEMNAKGAPLIAAARAQQPCRLFLLDTTVVVIDRMTVFSLAMAPFSKVSRAGID